MEAEVPMEGQTGRVPILVGAEKGVDVKNRTPEISGPCGFPPTPEKSTDSTLR